MSAAATWPNLAELLEDGFTFPAMEQRAAPYPPEKLRAWAEDYAQSDPELADYLRKAASTPTALHAFNRPDADTRNANIALHYLVEKSLTPTDVKAARGRVAHAWGAKESTVKDIHTDHGPAAAARLANLLDYIDARTDFATRPQILQAIAADLTLRAASMPRTSQRK